MKFMGLSEAKPISLPVGESAQKLKIFGTLKIQSIFNGTVMDRHPTDEEDDGRIIKWY